MGGTSHDSSSPKRDTAVIEQKAEDANGKQAADVVTTADPESTIGVASNNPNNRNGVGEPTYLRGWKLWMLTAALWISLFLSTLETTIVSTSLVSITNALDGFILRDWIVTAYLLTYTGFLVIYAKFSDVFGQKTMLLLALAIFTIFSALCGAASEIVELILFRAFQGVGASGIYSMIMVIAPGLIPPAKYGKYMAIVATVFIVASVLGPILGGVINRQSSWRWVFLLKLDVVGMFLLLAWTVLLVFALEEGGTRFPWNSAAVISTLVLAVVLAIVFGFWEVYTETSTNAQEPVFPPSICKDRLVANMLLTAFFVGFPFVSIVVNIPQRAQAVGGFSPVKAGIALLPLLLTSPLATALSGFLTGTFKVPPFYLIIISSTLQLVGVGLTCSLPVDATSVPAAQYGYEVIMGVGFGMGLTTLLTFARVVVPEKHLAVMMGAITQIRVLGGAISLAICATILNNHLRPKLQSLLGPEEAALILDSLQAIEKLNTTQQAQVRRAFAEGYHLQNIFMAAMTGLGLITSLFLWEKVPRKAA
ncbi:mfs-type transporter [Trichoderma arundinaceum]|uniref:Mfs-type transporter n=1 Tax=Trichoderma arundinaceum TaxID=490622 RepID=A0A395NEY3_TRIAR|nr:mfs-type transporter [Trichoderma arundinaceum]